MTRIVRTITVAAVLIGGVVACNAILGNEEGTLKLTLDDGGLSGEGGGPRPGAEAGPGGNEAGAPICDTTQGNKVCFGLCVKINEPNTGCGGTSCSACDPKNVELVTCKGGQTTLGCAYDKCKSGFDSCDGDEANGCEASLNRKETCGSCNVRCDVDAGTPLCAASGGSYACVASCPPGTQDCSGACVDTTSSLENCGACGKKCDRVSATAECQKGECVFTCSKGTHECAGACVSDLDPEACGEKCLKCPSGGPNSAPACSENGCAVVCTDGWIDCNGKPDDGCEYQGNSCPIVAPSDELCGGVKVCNALERCCKGRCQALNFLCL